MIDVNLTAATLDAATVRGCAAHLMHAWHAACMSLPDSHHATVTSPVSKSACNEQAADVRDMVLMLTPYCVVDAGTATCGRSSLGSS